jgi:hypothetical protein
MHPHSIAVVSFVPWAAPVLTERHCHHLRARGKNAACLALTLKKLLAERDLEIEVMKEISRKKW